MLKKVISIVIQSTGLTGLPDDEKSKEVLEKNNSSKLESLPWGDYDRDFVTALINANNLLVDTEGWDLVIKDQELAFVKTVFEGKKTLADNVFVCEKKANGDILVKKMFNARFDREAEKRPKITDFQPFASVDADVTRYISDSNLKVRLVVDRGRRGIGHQTAAVTAINRL